MRAQNARLHGFIAPGFEEVRAEFARNFAERGEIGAAVAAFWRGEKVVDRWGGDRTPEGDVPWNEDTMVVVMSTTKGLSAMTLALANARGWLDYDAPVVRYWPEFGQNGKAGVTVRQLLGHEAGLVLLDERLTLDKLRALGITAETHARITALPVMASDLDAVLGVPSHFSLAFLRPGPTVFFGSSPRAFGAPGAGGSFGFADPDARLRFAYVMNKLDFYLENDPREKALRDAVYRTIGRLAG